MPASRRPGVRRAPFVSHAQLVDASGALVAAGGLQGDEWVAVVAGRALQGNDSPGMLVAMLRHISERLAATGRATRLVLSPQLQNAARAEAEAAGHTLDAWLAVLEAERAENAEKKRAAKGPSAAAKRALH